MFLHHLPPETRTAFFNIARRFVGLDRTREDRRTELLRGYAAEMGISEPERLLRTVTDDPDPEAEERVAAAGRGAIAATLLEIIGLGMADGQYASQDQEFISKLALAFSVDADELQEMEQWVWQQVSLYRKADRFFD